MRRRRKIRRSETTAVDRISEFPDSILLQILSLLPIEDAVQTHVLSKRWQFLWTFLPSLTFPLSLLERFPLRYPTVDDEDFYVARRNGFATFVDKTLMYSKCKQLKKFELEYEYEPRWASNVDSWTLSAAAKGAEELCLRIFPVVSLDYDEGYELPQLLYDNSRFKELRLSWCGVIPKGNVAWYSLSKLSLSYVKLSTDVIERILAGSPVLEILELHEIQGFSCLDVTNSHLKKLILRDLLRATWDDIDSGLEVSAPYLLSLEISGYFGMSCRLLNVSSLVDAIFSCSYECNDRDWANGYERIQHIVWELLASLLHVKNLTLGTWEIEVLSMMEAKGSPSPLLKCTCLTLRVGISKFVLPGIANLLGSSPNLETLVITVPSMSSIFCNKFWDTLTKLCNFDEKLYWTSQKRTFECLMLHLGKVKFDGLRWSYSDLNFAFIQFLLENASVLQKMVFDASRHDVQTTEEFFLKLLSFPRSSPNAAVTFYQ